MTELSENYKQQLEQVTKRPLFYLGQQVKTEDGIGIIVNLEYPFNGLYISFERGTCVVWFGMGCGDIGNPWVSRSYNLIDLSEYEK